MCFERWISSLLLLSLSGIITSSAYVSPKTSNQHQPPSTMIVGTVYCDTCFNQKLSRNFHRISGASVMIDCSNPALQSSFRKAVKTDKDGIFRVLLPSDVGKHIMRIKACTVKLISSNEPFCAVTASATSSSFHLKSTKNRVHLFSSGFFTFRPLNQPELCNQSPSFKDSAAFDAEKDLATILPLPSLSMPPIPLLLPLPTFPNLPPLPKFPPSATPAIPFFPGIPPLFPTNKDTKP